MSQPSVTAKVHQPLNIHTNFTAQITFYGHRTNLLTELFLLSLSQILDLCTRINACDLTQLIGSGASDTVNVSQANPSVCLEGQVNACYASHLMSPSSIERALVAQPTILLNIACLLKANYP